MTDLEYWWTKFIFNLLEKKPGAYIQVRKLFQHAEWEVPWEIFKTGIDFPCIRMGYASDKTKMDQLRRNYFNEEAIDKVREAFKSRINSRGAKRLQTCVTTNMLNREKKVTSMGQCIQTLTLNYLSDGKGDEGFYIDINYRSTEVIQKFLADLKFLNDIVFPRLLEGIENPPHVVRFTFSSLYISVMFLPIFFQFFHVDETLESLRDSDSRYYSLAISAVEKWMKKETNYSFRTRVRSHETFRNYVYPKLKKQQISNIKSLIKNHRRSK